MGACGVEYQSGNASLIGGLQRVEGIALARSTSNRQDNTLQAWSWTAGTFSWVEPTAWCLLSLKKCARIPGVRVNSSRLDQAERLLIDRSCVGGGWNYGNAVVLEQELKPYVPTTAVALLAMQDRQAHPAVGRSLNYLEQHATSERSGTALALASLALLVCGRWSGRVQAALVEQLPITMDLGNHAAIALAYSALAPEHTHAAFSL
jgi:hypothetical protein